MSSVNKPLLEAGDIIKLDRSYKVYATVPEHFVYSNRKGDFTLTRSEILIARGVEYLVGRYVVTKVAVNMTSDRFNDGWHVFCRKILEEDETIEHKVDFYLESVLHAPINKKVEVVGKAEARWVETTTKNVY
jgi:hypothetical protein